MESVKVLVVFVAVFHCSLSRPRNPEDELRVIVRQLESLVARKYTGTSPPPPITWTDSPLGPRVPDDEDSDSSDEDYKMLFEKFDRLLKPYFDGFPSGTFTSTMPLTRETFVRMVKEWYNLNSGTPSDTMPFRGVFFNASSAFLNARFQCATSKINQMIYYVLKDQERAMTSQDEKSMYTLVKNILGKHITDESTLNEVMRTMVKAAHMHVFGTMMNIKYFLLHDVMELFGRMKMMLNTAEEENWTVTKFEQAMNELMSDSDIVFRCPPLSELWEYHRELARDFQEMLKENFFSEAEAWLKNYLSKYITNPAPVISEILPLYTKYVKAVEWNFAQLENHMTTGNIDDITTFVSKFLKPDQMTYLKSIFEHLKTTGMDMGTSGAMDSFIATGEEENPEDIYGGY